MTTSDFLLRFEEFLGQSGWPTEDSPWDIVQRWEHFADACANCYQWSFYEFDNEVRVRSLLEKAFRDPRMAGYTQLQEMEQRVNAADNRFRQLLSDKQIRDEQAPWWLRAVLARAGEEYREDLKQLYGIDVAPCLCHNR